MAKNTTVFDKLYFPKKPNYEYTPEYFASKASNTQQALGYVYDLSEVSL